MADGKDHPYADALTAVRALTYVTELDPSDTAAATLLSEAGSRLSPSDLHGVLEPELGVE